MEEQIKVLGHINSIL